MVENLECRRFRNRLDAYVDGELSASEKEEMRRHAQNCAECAKLLEEYESMLKMLSVMDEETEIPPEAAQGWRSLVRDEAERNRRHAGRGWIRAAGSFAAAFVLLLGMTGLYRSGFNPTAVNGKTNEKSNLAVYEEAYDSFAEYESAAEYGAVTGGGFMLTSANDTQTAVTATARKAVVESDGAVQDSVETEKQEKENRKPVVIRSASRTMQSKSFDEDMAAIETLVGDYEGWFGYRSLTGKSWEEGGEGRWLDLEIRVPTETMDDFLTELKQIGSTIRMTDSSEDISGNYYDSKARLDALKAQQQRLNDLITDAADLDDLISLEDKLYEVQSEVDSLEGLLRDMDSRAQYSEVDVTLSEVREYTEPENVEKTLGQRIRDGFRDSIDWVKCFCQDMLVAVVTFSPALVVVIPAILIVGFVVRSIRRRRNRRY